MGYLFHVIDDDKVVSISISAIAIGLSCYTLWRAGRSERRVRALAFAQRKMEALNLITDGEVASLTFQDSCREIADDANEAGLEDSQQQAIKWVTDEEISLGKLRDVRTAILAQQSSSMTHTQLLEFIESHLAALGDLVNVERYTGRNSGALRSARRSIKIAKIVNEKFTETVGGIDGSRRAFLQFYMELEDLLDVCKIKGTEIAAKRIGEVMVETSDRLKRLGDARAGITAGLVRKRTSRERQDAAEDMLAHKIEIEDLLGAQTAEDLISVDRHKIKRLMTV